MGLHIYFLTFSISKKTNCTHMLYIASLQKMYIKTSSIFAYAHCLQLGFSLGNTLICALPSGNHTRENTKQFIHCIPCIKAHL